MCNKGFINTASLKVHERKHTGEKPFTCSKCDKAFQQNCDLEKHERTHTGEKPFACSKWISHQTHERTHGEKTHHCKQCDKKFCKSFPMKKQKTILLQLCKNFSYLPFLEKKYAKFLVTLLAMMGFLTNVFSPVCVLSCFFKSQFC